MAEFESPRWTVTRSHNVATATSTLTPSWSSSIMSTPTANWSTSISHHICATRKILKGVIFDTKYIWRGEMCRVGGLTTEFTGS